MVLFEWLLHLFVGPVTINSISGIFHNRRTLDANPLQFLDASREGLNSGVSDTKLQGAATRTASTSTPNVPEMGGRRSVQGAFEAEET